MRAYLSTLHQILEFLKDKVTWFYNRVTNFSVPLSFPSPVTTEMSELKHHHYFGALCEKEKVGEGNVNCAAGFVS